MKTRSIIISFLLLSFVSSQALGQKVNVTLSSSVNEIHAGQPLILTVKVTNTSKKVISIPSKASFSSTFLPNGLKMNHYPAHIQIEFTPASLNHRYFLETPVMILDPDINKPLLPNQSVQFSYDLNKHFEYALSIESTKFDDLFLEEKVEITAEFSFEYYGKRNQIKALRGHFKSSTIELDVVK